MLENIIEVKKLKTIFNTESGIKEIVKGISFHIKKGKITCIVGESGSGKSITVTSMIKMLPKNALISDGSILFHGQDLTKMTEKEIREIRGKKIFTVFQNPMNCFNPSLTMETQIYDLISSNIKIGRGEFEIEFCQIMKNVNLENAAAILKQYPFQLSGGMLQRMMIAAAIFMKPDIIIADEPTTALDVTTQKEILRQFKLIQKKYNTTILMITHDFGVVAEIADEVLVMQEGAIVEKGNVFEIFNAPKHSYTISLIKATFNREVEQVC
jgi:ABC-type dipeptide/oligopeptide/nickel transport system ATPase component